MNTQMSLEEYKKKAGEYYLKCYSNTTKEELEKWILTTSNEWWQVYMEDFSPEVAVQGMLARLI